MAALGQICPASKEDTDGSTVIDTDKISDGCYQIDTSKEANGAGNWNCCTNLSGTVSATLAGAFNPPSLAVAMIVAKSSEAKLLGRVIECK